MLNLVKQYLFKGTYTAVDSTTYDSTIDIFLKNHPKIIFFYLEEYADLFLNNGTSCLQLFSVFKNSVLMDNII